VGDFRSAWASIAEAWRDFRWLEYRPFMWMMLAELLFLFLASNLTTRWGMAGAGWILRTSGEPAVHYPASFLHLVSAFARVESALFAIAGSFLIPLSLARIQAPMIGIPPTGPETVRRAWRAYPVTLAGYLLNVALLIAWEYLLGAGPRRWIAASFLAGRKGELLIWGVGMLVAFAIAAVFIYVPIRAVEERSKFGDTLWGGIREGLRAFGPTLFLVLVFAWPAMLLLAPLQIAPTLIVSRVRPELTAVLLSLVAVANSFVNYFIFAAASRLHWLMRRAKP
jgi:hypothetical protein